VCILGHSGGPSSNSCDHSLSPPTFHALNIMRRVWGVLAYKHLSMDVTTRFAEYVHNTKTPPMRLDLHLEIDDEDTSHQDFFFRTWKWSGRHQNLISASGGLSWIFDTASGVRLRKPRQVKLLPRELLKSTCLPKNERWHCSTTPQERNKFHLIVFTKVFRENAE
jgi:hypothetical protein